MHLECCRGSVKRCTLISKRMSGGHSQAPPGMSFYHSPLKHLKADQNRPSKRALALRPAAQTDLAGLCTDSRQRLLCHALQQSPTRLLGPPAYLLSQHLRCNSQEVCMHVQSLRCPLSCNDGLSTCRFTTPEGQRSLLNVLQAYAAFDEEVNYCQGMNFLAALMLTWLPREAEAFGALVLVMKDRGLRELYKSDMQMLQV